MPRVVDTSDPRAEMAARQLFHVLRLAHEPAEDLPTEWEQLARSHDRVSGVVAFAEVKDERARLWKKLPNDARDAFSGLLHQSGGADTARERGFLAFLHLMARDDHG